MITKQYSRIILKIKFLKAVIKIINKITENKIKTVLVAITPYHFLVYIAACGKIDYNSTLLITTDAVSGEIAKKFSNKLIVSKLPTNMFLKFFGYLIYKFKYIPIKLALVIKNKKINFYGVDHVFLADFLTLKKYTLIEDGLVNYVFSQKNNSSFYKLIIKDPYGVNSKCKKIFLTGIHKISDIIKYKVEKISITNSEFKAELLGFFSVKPIKLNKNNILLITQPLSEDNLCNEDEKIALYKRVIETLNIDATMQIFIKPHPREKTDYKLFFKTAKIIDKNVPMEIYTLAGEFFNTAITLFSTAVYNIKAKEKVFFGTFGVDFLEKRFGIIDAETKKF
ncbi:glycosyltransferase family 52 [Tenacibaculum soleae]|uniref:glycosyltransferase family 52 n=1 Tax=Tenacibaculum soleae TaxID=447689 RepID=UPI0026E2230C|nr:glycosyltransferase family 52 [Tenacibaculum soleae]MDO6743445.1 glycosyltransferase family 52 [Tenacibaculum soleae]